MTLILSISDTKYIEILDNKYFKFLKKLLVDYHVYDQSVNAIPYPSRSIKFAVSGVYGKTIQIVKSGVVVKVLPECVTDSMDFYLKLDYGDNKIHCQVLHAAADRSTPLFLTTYNIETFLWLYAKEFLDRRHDALQTQQNIYIEDDLVVEDGISYDTQLEALRDRWGNLFRIERPEGWDKDKFRNFLKAFITAYYNYPLTKKAFDLVVEALTGVPCILFEYPKENFAPVGRRLKIYSGLSTGLLDNFSFEEGDPPESWVTESITNFVRVSGGIHEAYCGQGIAVGTLSPRIYQTIDNFPSGVDYCFAGYIYVPNIGDWSSGPKLVIRDALDDVLYESDSVIGSSTWEELSIEFDASGGELFQFGIEGTVTNGGLYIDLCQVSRCNPHFSFGWDITEVHLDNRWYHLSAGPADLANTSSGAETVVCLHPNYTVGENQEELEVLQLDSISADSGAEYVVMGVVTPGSYYIEKIEGCYRIDKGAVVLDDTTTSFGFEVYASGSSGLEDFEKDQLVMALSRLKPGHKLGYLMTEVSGGEEDQPLAWNHYLRGYEYYSKI